MSRKNRKTNETNETPVVVDEAPVAESQVVVEEPVVVEAVVKAGNDYIIYGERATGEFVDGQWVFEYAGSTFTPETNSVAGIKATLGI